MLMLIFIIIWLLLLGFISLNSMYLLVIFMFMVFLVNLNASLPFLQVVIYNYLAQDSYSYWLSYLTLFVLLSVVVVYQLIHSNTNYSYLLSIIVLMLSCILIFSTNNFFALYVFFEFSLLPISYIIIKWGSYGERSTSVIYMLAYTIVFSLPSIVVLSMIQGTSMLIYSGIMANLIAPAWLLAFVFFMFAVNLPVYGVHYWLPMAHVEAPTYGSMVLAGILLNLGGYGIYRLLSIFDYQIYSSFIFSYFFVGMVLASVVSCVQLDMNRLVAYSSVVHITTIMISILSLNFIGLNSFLLVMLLHGLVSPLIFMLVGTIYAIYGSRLLVISRGLVYLISFILPFILVFILLNQIPTPPFGTFLAEVIVFVSCYTYGGSTLLLFIILLTFISLVFNLVWFIPSFIYNASSVTSVFIFNYTDLFVIVLYVIECIVILGMVVFV